MDEMEKNTIEEEQSLGEQKATVADDTENETAVEQETDNEKEHVPTAAENFVHEEGEVHFTCPMRFKDLFAFRLRYAYLGLNGIAFWILTVLIVGCLIGYWDSYQQSTRVLMIALLVILCIYQPGNSALRTLQYTTQLKADNVVLEYFINSSGILVIQGENSDLIAWNVIRKVKETRKRFLISVMRNSAFVFGKDVLLEQTAQLKHYIDTAYTGKKS